MERIRPTSGSDQPISSTPRPSSRPSVPSKVLVTVIVLAGVLVLLGIGAFTFSKFAGGPVNSDRYQAVFLTNGQVYFGRLSNINSGYVKLNDIYYLQVTQTEAENALQDEDSAQAQQQISLAKLGNELHAPEDEMYISQDQILFWENLKEEGQVTEAIQDYVDNGGATNNVNTNTNTGGASGTQPAGSDQQQDDTSGDANGDDL